MSELPCIGFGITVVDSGSDATQVFERGRNGFTKPRKKQPRRWVLDRPLRLLRATVTANDEAQWHTDRGNRIYWKCGARTGGVWENDEMVTWTRGHGPEARAAFLAARALLGVK
jgi:hypothetical protein